MIRNLLDIPDEAEALRHTYLRVLYPLLSHTQLRHPPHYKREEILRLLHMLSIETSTHFKPLDQTTIRLTRRCMKVPWLQEQQDHRARGLLGISLGAAGDSTHSVLEVAAMKEKPGVLTPSRKDSREHHEYDGGSNGVMLREGENMNSRDHDGRRGSGKVSEECPSVVIGET